MMAHRKAVVAAASVAAVLLAGAVAVGANVGILDSGDGGLGELSAASAGTFSAGSSADGAAAPAETSSSESHQTFEVDRAGSVTLDADGQVLSVASVQPSDGWTWTTDRRSDTELSVELTSGTDSLTLHASFDGRDIRARVEEGGVPATGSTAPDVQDHHEDEHDEHHEYEGHDDDD